MFTLSHTFVGDAGAPKLALLLHGALGAGNNLRSLASKIVKNRADYRFCLVDLRHHGSSQGAPPPNTLESCAKDLHELIVTLGSHPDAIAGHSFGGKVGLMFASLYPDRVKQLWLLDSNPGSQSPDPNHEVLRIISLLREVTVPAPNRESVVSALTQRGLSSGTANWVVTNLKREPHGLVWRFNLDLIQELMLDYFRVDLWPELVKVAQVLDVRLLIAEHSDRWTLETRAHAESLATATELNLHTVPNAGHWLHVDNPEYVTDLLAAGLL